MKKIVIGIMLCFSMSIVQAQVVAEKYGYKLYRSDLVDIYYLVEHLSGKKPTNSQWQDIYYGSRGHFFNNPRGFTNAVKLLKGMHDTIKKADKRNEFEYELAIHNTYHTLVSDKWNFWDHKNYRNILKIIKQNNRIFPMNITEGKFFLQSTDWWISRKNGYYLTEFMLNGIIDTAEFIAQRKFSAYDKGLIRKWAIKDFQDTPKGSTEIYAALLNNHLPKIRLQNFSPELLEKHRENIYTWFYFQVIKDVNPTNLNYNLMDIVTDYNPVFIEDRKNRVLISESTLKIGFSNYTFLGDIIGIPVDINEEMVKTDKRVHIKSFADRKNRKEYNSPFSARIIKAKMMWYRFNDKDKSILRKKMKKIYLKGGEKAAANALAPLYTKLDYIELERLLVQQYLLFSYNINQNILQIMNTSYTRHAQIMQDIADDFTKFNTRLSLGYGDVDIVQDTGTQFVVEPRNRPGERYYVSY